MPSELRLVHAVIPVAITLVGCHLHSDTWLDKNFMEHKPQFERLVGMMESEKEPIWLSTTFPPPPAIRELLSECRVADYQRLLKSAGLERLSRNGDDLALGL